MEIIIGLIIVAGIAFYLIRKQDEVNAPVVEQAPYKVETPVAAQEAQWPMVEQVVQSAKPKKAKEAKAPAAKAKQPAKAKSTAQKAPSAKPAKPKKPRVVRVK